MRVRVGGEARAGDAVDLRETPMSAARLTAAVERPGGGLLEAPAPGPLWRRVGHVHEGMAVSLRATLAAAARSRGDGDPPPSVDTGAGERRDAVDLAGARKRAARAGKRADELAERVAERRGELRAREELDAPTAETERALREAAASLSEATTERVAAEQALRQAREQAREARTARASRLRAVDRAENRERTARARLADAVYDEFAAAVTAVPGHAEVGDDPGAFDGPGWVAALAAVAVGDPSAPVVVSVGFDDADAAARTLDAPVVLASR